MDAKLGNPSQYEMLVRHALAVGGVAAVGFSTVDSESGAVTSVVRAESTAPEILAGITNIQQAHPDFGLSLLTCPTIKSTFVSRILASDELVHEGLASALAEVAPASLCEATQRYLQITHLIGRRTNAAGTDLGVVIFAVQGEPDPAALKILDEIVQRIGRILDSTVTRPESGRERLRQRLDAALALAETAAVASQIDVDTLFQSVVDWLRTSLEADVVTIVLIDETGRLVLRAVSTSPAAKESGLGARPDRAWPIDRGLTGWVARTIQSALSPNVNEDPRANPRPGHLPESVIAAPLLSQGRAIGVIRAGSSKLGHFREQDLHLIEILARQCSIAIEQARVLQTSREQNDRLALFARIVDGSHDPMIIVDPSGRIQYCNNATCRLYGYTCDELIGTATRDLLPPESDDIFEQILATLARHEEWTGEVAQIRKDGSRFPADLSVGLVRDDAQRTIGTIAVVRDLTQRKQQEAQLLQAEKLRSLGVLASGVAHQINNVLASVLGHAELLLDRATDPSTRRQLELIVKASEDGAVAVRRIQEFAQARPLQGFVPLDLTTIVDDVISATAPRWRDQAQRQGRSISVGASVNGPAYVQGDPAELREALSNLVLNAVDAIPGSGAIDVTIDASADPIAITIRDTGEGMTDDVLQRAFDPFFTTKPLGAGVGLGLALTHSIIQRHGGSISANSEVGRGTTFKILLARGEPPEPEATPALEAKMRGLHVLVVDDEADLADQLEMILTLNGHSVHVCHGGSEAIEALTNQQFDLVITDLGMPDIGGWDVAREAKRRQPRVQVALLTGWANELVGTHELHERGLDFVITKPYRIQAIQDLMAAASKAAHTDH